MSQVEAFGRDGIWDVTAKLAVPAWLLWDRNIGPHELGTWNGRKYRLLGAELVASSQELRAAVEVRTVGTAKVGAELPTIEVGPAVILGIVALLVAGATVVSWHAVERVPGAALGIGWILGAVGLVLLGVSQLRGGRWK